MGNRINTASSLGKLRRFIAQAFGLLMLLSLVGNGALYSQQVPISNMYTVSPHWMNPAAVGTTSLNQVFLSHQQRRLKWTGLQSMSQFLNYQSGPQGRKGNFGWGAFINNDIEHTENRISLNGAIAVQLLHSTSHQFSVGINGGFMNWGSNYDSVRVYDRPDPILARPSNFAELDAGVGARYAYTSYFMKGEANAAVSQLPGNLASRSGLRVELKPQLLAGGSALFTLDNNLYVGPIAFYRNTFFANPISYRKGTVDLGGKMELTRWGFWASGAYRINDAAVMAGFGLKVINPDTLFESSRTAYFLGINATGTYPLNESHVFGPSFELGIVMQFGRVGEITSRQDTLEQIRGAFWKNDGNINTHKLAHLTANAPPNLRARTNPEEKIVLLSYAWDDDIYEYLGETPQVAYDTLLSAVGQEWVGIDGIMGNLVTEVIKEALYPDTINTQYPDSIERLRNLSNIEFRGLLKVDEMAAGFGAQGAVYKGDLRGRKGADTLNIKVRYAGQDTLVTIIKGQNLSNLQLACLKLHSMRKRFEYEFNKHYGRDMALFWDGESINDEKMKGRKPVFMRTPELVPNNPNQKPCMVGQVRMQFTRIPNYFENKALSETKGKGKGKGKNKNQGSPLRGKDAYRDPVGTVK